MATSKYILQGGGEHARVVLDCLLASGAEVRALFDPKYSGRLFGVPQLGSYDASFEPDALAIVAIGDNAVRKKVANFTLHHFGSVIHPSAVISPSSNIGLGCAIVHGVIVQTQCRIGNHVIFNTASQSDHDCVIADFVHIAPGVILCGSVEVGEGAFVGAGAIVIPGIRIGAWAKVGAGSVVINDIPDFAVAVGNPAKVITYDRP